jgi:hypothetical protein
MLLSEVFTDTTPFFPAGGGVGATVGAVRDASGDRDLPMGAAVSSGKRKK